jgi:hypothetical protein
LGRTLSAAGEELAQVPLLIRLHTGIFRFVDLPDDDAASRIISAGDTIPQPLHINRYHWVDGRVVM